MGQNVNMLTAIMSGVIPPRWSVVLLFLIPQGIRSLNTKVTAKVSECRDILWKMVMPCHLKWCSRPFISQLKKCQHTFFHTNDVIENQNPCHHNPLICSFKKCCLVPQSAGHTMTLWWAIHDTAGVLVSFIIAKHKVSLPFYRLGGQFEIGGQQCPVIEPKESGALTFCVFVEYINHSYMSHVFPTRINFMSTLYASTFQHISLGQNMFCVVNNHSLNWTRKCYKVAL